MVTNYIVSSGQTSSGIVLNDGDKPTDSERVGSTYFPSLQPPPDPDVSFR